jgi:hypothetical protein
VLSIYLGKNLFSIREEITISDTFTHNDDTELPNWISGYSVKNSQINPNANPK